LRTGAVISDGSAGSSRLVQQRREQVVVLPVDDRDVDRLAGQLPRALQPPEPGTDA